jgi:hypothetical protein
MEAITNTNDRRLEARIQCGGAISLRAFGTNLESAGRHYDVILLTRAEIAALAAKFPVEEKQ